MSVPGDASSDGKGPAVPGEFPPWGDTAPTLWELQSHQGHTLPQSDGGDSSRSGGTPVSIETPYPDLALHSDGPELESQL